ncbi:MAG TPA: GAF domain-containing protein [Blastocatellia bacterium]|nr:GAF domain-containing protein [Blastocatellia bacterium]
MKTTRIKIVAAIILLIAAIFVSDRLLPADVSASVLYVVPILLTLALRSTRALAFITVLTALTTLTDFLLTTDLGVKQHLWSDELLALLAQLTTATLVWMQLRAGERERAMHEKAERERRRLALVHSIASATSGTLDLEDVLKSVADKTAGLLKADTVALWLVDESGTEIRPAHYNSDSYRDVEERYKSVRWQLSDTTLGEAIRRREVLIASADERTPSESQKMLEMIGAEMAIAVPLFARERLVGAMTIALERRREFRPNDLAVIETIGRQVATAIDNALLFSSIKKQREQLALVNEIGQVFASTLDLEGIYNAMRERLRQIVDCDSLLVSLYDHETETIRCGFAYADGEVLSPDQFEPIKLGIGPQSDCIRTAKPIVVSNIVKQHRGRFRYVGRTDNNPVSIIYVPMIAEERVIGVIQLQSLREGAYDETDAPLLSIIANQAAIAIQNARLYREAVEGRNAMERASRMKDEFLAMLSHELRTPLTPILGWTRILSRLSPDEHEMRAHALEVIERNTLLQTQLVNDLLDLSRIESGKVSVSPQPVDLNAAAQAAIESIRDEADARGITIKTEFACGNKVMADPSRLGQILNNLLTNSVKFTDAGGSILVKTASEEGAGVLVVKDSGIGIAREFLPLIFDKFRQADSSIRRRHSGLGLGLSIVKSLVELHGGSIAAHSEGEGHGATFTVRLPLATQLIGNVAEDKIKEAGSSVARAVSGAEIRLLVIEDDADTLEMMRVLCDSQNISIIGASTADEAFAALERETPDLIISDIMLPGIDGHEIARRLRGHDHLKRIPLIAITGLISDYERERSFEAGFDAHIVKPINYSELFALVRELVGARVATGD